MAWERRVLSLVRKRREWVGVRWRERGVRFIAEESCSVTFAFLLTCLLLFDTTHQPYSTDNRKKKKGDQTKNEI